MSCNVRLNRQTFYHNHRDELKQKCKNYYYNNIQKFRDYYQDNKEKIKEYGREHSKDYYQRCKEGLKEKSIIRRKNKIEPMIFEHNIHIKF